MSRGTLRVLLAGGALGLLVAPLAATIAHAAATVTIVNNDGAGEGFNDPTPVAAVGGNPGTTLGAQRLNAVQYAANLWGALLNSSEPVLVSATFDALPCSGSGAVLGLAGPRTFAEDFAGAPVADTWYPIALANMLAGLDLDPGNDDIDAQFNSVVGFGCALPSAFYLGLDASPPGGDIDLATVVLHELCHGLGFGTLVNLATGAKSPPTGLDDTFMLNLEDHSLPLDWPSMTAPQRVTSSTDTGDLHWTGAGVVLAGSFLAAGRDPISGHVQMFAPATPSASSVSHFDTALAPNEIMEPAYTGANHSPGLAALLLADIGWSVNTPPSTTTTSTSTSTSTTTIAAVCSPTALGGCVAPTKAVLLVKETSPGNEKLKLVLKQLVPSVIQSQFGDPVTGTSQVNLCLYDDTGALVADLNVANAGAQCGTPPVPCWKAISTLGYKYGDKATAADGVAKIVAKGGDPLKGKLVFKAANNLSLGQANLPTGIAALLLNDTQATVQIVVDDGDCFGQTVTNVKKADGLLFKALEP